MRAVKAFAARGHACTHGGPDLLASLRKPIVIVPRGHEDRPHVLHGVRGRRLRTDPRPRGDYEAGQLGAPGRLRHRNLFDKPEEFFDLDELRMAAAQPTARWASRDPASSCSARYRYLKTARMSCCEEEFFDSFDADHARDEFYSTTPATSPALPPSYASSVQVAASRSSDFTSLQRRRHGDSFFRLGPDGVPRRDPRFRQGPLVPTTSSHRSFRPHARHRYQGPHRRRPRHPRGQSARPQVQVEQITIALIYKFMDDMDRRVRRLGRQASFFAKEFAKYSWRQALAPRLSAGRAATDLYAEAIEKMTENQASRSSSASIFKNAYLPYRDPETLRLFLRT